MKAHAARAWRWGAGAALLLAAAAAPAQEGSRPGDTLRYPYIAALSRSSGGERVYFCAGTLVAPRWILTAAHCFHAPGGTRIGTEGLAAEVGASRLRDVPAAAQVRVARIVVHPSYDPQSQDNDLALVELAEEAGPLTAELATRETAESGQGTVLGFGSFYEGQLAGTALSASGAPAAQVSDRLREAAVRILDAAACAARIGDEAHAATLICAGAGAEATCVGDSGGPLIVGDRVAGIVTLGSGCAAERPVTVYTRVAAYAPWIASVLQGR